MSWERRRSAHYYYFGIRESGRVCKLYLGRGVEAELAADAVADKKAERALLRAEQAAIERLVQKTGTLSVGCRLIAEAALYSQWN